MGHRAARDPAIDQLESEPPLRFAPMLAGRSEPMHEPTRVAGLAPPP